jgi:hypothetical protein
MSSHTPVCELLGIEHPIVEAPLAPTIPACPLWAGQSVALAKQRQPAAEIVAELSRL